MTKTENINVKVGQRMAALRTERLLSQEELAFRCGLHRAYIGTIERGEKSPTLTTLAKIAKGLNVRMEEFFKEIEIEDEQGR